MKVKTHTISQKKKKKKKKEKWNPGVGGGVWQNLA
jgi:hypothetical protein